MSSVTVTAIEMKGRALSQFIKMPWLIYRGPYGHDPLWVPPLLMDERALFNPAKNPFYRHLRAQLFLATKGGELVGRIAAIRDENFIKEKQEQIGFFGFFESINDHHVASALLDAARQWCAHEGCSRVIGPVSLTPNQVLSLLIENFDEPPVIYTPYNPPYYRELIEGDGWKKDFDFYAYRYDGQKHSLSPKTFRVIELMKKKAKVSIRPVSKKSWAEDALSVLEIWNEAWLGHPEFMPWDREDFLYMVRDLKHAISEDFAQLAFVDGEPVGFSIPLPNVNEALIKGNGRLTPAMIFRLWRVLKRSNYLRIAILGVKHKYQKQGIEAVFVAHIQQVAAQKGYRFGDMSLIVDSNAKLLRMLDNFGFDRYRRYRIFTKGAG